jgi:hypothetical protein
MSWSSTGLLYKKGRSQPWANFLYIFSPRKVIFCGKFQFFPTFFGEKFSAEFSLEKKCTKNQPLASVDQFRVFGWD